MTGAPDRSTIAVEGGTLDVEVRGRGTPLLLLHAGIADAGMWDAQVAALDEDVLTIRYDQRGFGRTPLPPCAFSYAEDAVAVLEQLAAEPAMIVGASFGGAIAIDVCLMRPDLVSALVLVGSSVGGFEGSDALDELEEKEEELLDSGDLEAAAVLSLQTWVDGPSRSPAEVDPEMRRSVGEMLLRGFRMPMPEGVSQKRLTPPAINRLPAIEVSTLVVVGELDRPEMIDLSARLAREIPRAVHRTMAGAAHLPNMEQPAVLNEMVRSFIRAHVAGEPS